MNLVGGRKRRQTLMSFTKRLFSAKAKCFKQIRRADSFPSPSVSGEGSVSECMVVIVVCCFPKKSMTSDGDDEDKFSPLVVPRFLMITVFVRRPGLNPTGRFVTCRATVAKKKRSARFFFSPLYVCFYLFPKMSRLLNSQHRYSPPLWRHPREFGKKPTKWTEEKLAVFNG